jgi:hypothetical protein
MRYVGKTVLSPKGATAKPTLDATHAQPTHPCQLSTPCEPVQAVKVVQVCEMADFRLGVRAYAKYPLINTAIYIIVLIMH